MTVGVLIITHNRIGEEMLTTAQTIVGQTLNGIANISIPGDLEPGDLGKYADKVKQGLLELDQGDGVLIITDMPGATPSNLARYFATDRNVRIITGLNLAMLIRIINYIDQPLELLAEIGIVGANKGISQEDDL